jgi:hypothetical protein
VHGRAPRPRRRASVLTRRARDLGFYDRRVTPHSRTALADLYFLEHRAKLLDIAAFLDRCDRAPADGPDDFRLDALRRALPILTDGRPHRARRVLELMSDHSTLPIDSAPMKGAMGAVDLR